MSPLFPPERYGLVVIVERGDAKNRKAATLPLRKETAVELRGFIGTKQPIARVLRMPRPEYVVVALRGELKAAEIA